MGFFSKLAGVTNSFVQLGGPGGDGINYNSVGVTALEMRNAANAAFINARGADPLVADDLVTKRYVDLAAPTGVQTVTNGSSPLAVVTSTRLVNADVSGGVVTVNLYAAPATGSHITVKNSAGDSSVSVITVTPAAGTIEDPNNPLVFGASATIKVKGAAVQFTFDGTRWEITN